ncbi:conserved hypothetical protein [Uncinocarpus reesii 1704]|uniref:Mnd1 HTH domain-containing protein n=1 Tax=Uncinocarpus reesii (strain UAMH 1704) TaxID=336963 RepID=C4JES0_UNCRE|nr:uncharacterized protein UREG_02230 [Uncinocarpus reesii 1704]EEP77381.1 conserved hypothetical protein [Uncinocarpus reesii 1704]
MDETALIALGILLEETAVEALGTTGDMVFVEGAEIGDDEETGYESGATVASARRSVSTAREFPGAIRARTVGVGRNDDDLTRVWSTRKKRRLTGLAKRSGSFNFEPIPKREVLSLMDRCPSTRRLNHSQYFFSTEYLQNKSLTCVDYYKQRMGPSKSLPPAAKQALILTHLRSTRTCHTLKDLEKMLPSIASINGMQVKDYIQALADDGKIHIEKIGSGNWYWAWAGEEKKARDKILSGLVKDLERIDKAVAELQSKVDMAKAEIGHSEGVEEEAERREMLAKNENMEAEVLKLKSELDQYTTGKTGGSVDMMGADITRWKGEAEMWTDNIYILEEYLKKLTGGDREILESLRREYYGEEYVEGEGLREL